MLKGNSHHYTTSIIIACIFWVFWFFLGNQYTYFWKPDVKNTTRLSGYKYISPLIECSNDSYDAHQTYIPFEKKLVSRIQQEIINPHPDIHVSVYFRNLLNGPWFGINEDEKFSPASLLKIPILIAYLWWSEKNPEILNTEFEALSSDVAYQNILPEDPVIIWKKYKVLDLLSHLIIQSDNKAADTLMFQLPLDIYYETFEKLWIPRPEIWDFITVKDYASFFRILYNASYLDKQSSEYALDLLTKITFEEGLRKWVPAYIPIAHKFWERSYTGANITTKQLHDCGIVYYVHYPYLVCIMTKWNVEDIKTLSPIIADTSKIIFEEVSWAFK